MKTKKAPPLRGLIAFAFLLLQACGGGAPLDADTRNTIDSTATAQISKLRIELDSACAQYERAQMAHLIDSIKTLRLQEIQQQLKTVPK